MSQEFNIVRLYDLTTEYNYTYFDILNPAKPMDVFYYRYDRDYVKSQLEHPSPTDCLYTLDQYIGKHFNNLSIRADFASIPDFIDSIKQQAIPGLPTFVYMGSWKVFLLPVELVKALHSAGIYILLDESYEGFIDHLYSYFSWLTMCGMQTVDNIRIISGRFNGHPSLKHGNIQWTDLDLEPVGVRVLSFPFFWFHSVNMFKHYKDRLITLDKQPGTVLSLNNWLRQHRILTLMRLLYNGTLDKITWSAIDSSWETLLDVTRNHKEFNLEELDVDTWLDASLLAEFKNLLPKFLDIKTPDGRQSLETDAVMQLHDTHLVNLVNETTYGTGPWDPYGINQLPAFSDNYATEYDTRSLHRRYGFITEKTYKAIVSGQMFIISGSANTLTNLRKLGFKTFGQYFNEGYDFEINDDQRYIKVCDTVDTIVNTRWNLAKDATLQEILEHNKQHFFDLSALTEQAYELVEFLRDASTDTNY
jgi:hypothetical protein